MDSKNKIWVKSSLFAGARWYFFIQSLLSPDIYLVRETSVQTGSVNEPSLNVWECVMVCFTPP